MITMNANVRAADIADLNRAVDLMVRNTTRLAPDAVKRASYHFLVSAKAQTPQAKKKARTLHTGSEGGRPTRFYIARRQGKTPLFIHLPNPDLVKGRERKREAREMAAKLKEKYKNKPHMRAAKNSWNRAFRDLGKAVAYTMDVMSRRVLAASRAKKLGGNFTPAMRITNELSYLPKIAPMLEGNALASAGKKLLEMVGKGIEKQTRKFA